MQHDLIERGWTDINAASPKTGAVAHFTDPGDALWTGIVEIGAVQSFTLEAGWRHDLYVLRGDVEVDGQRLHHDDFLIQCGAGVVRAGQGGARLFVYREASGSRCEPAVCGAASRAWRDGRNPRLRVAPLSNRGHIVSMVEWKPGARHEPFASVPTVILLRNGRLQAASRPGAGEAAARDEDKRLDHTPASDLRRRRREF
jgi:hypothetical protein